MFKPFSGKIMLFGEYALLEGGNALTIPSNQFTGQLAVNPSTEEQKKSHESVLKFAAYLMTHFEDHFFLDALQNDLNQGLFFDANIPQGYGVGSSAAIVAALVSLYGKNIPSSLIDQKAFFGEVESFFHGKSSGLDVLVCYQQKPILIQNGEPQIAHLEMEQMQFKYELIDTHQVGHTNDMVGEFRAQNLAFFNSFRAQYLAETNLAVEAFLAGRFNEMFTSIKQLSFFAIDQMPWTIPASIKNEWEESLANPNLAYKLCGSGGGGFALKFSI
ncbi:MAG: mevalonate kinase [Bacteroidetes bacterium]|nr:mevalonate kinase [Bacteroidota bacterium]